MTALVIALIAFGAIGYLALVWLIAGFVGRRAGAGRHRDGYADRWDT